MARQIINAAKAYERWFVNHKVDAILKGALVGKSTDSRVAKNRAAWLRMMGGEKTQYQRDVAMWYATVSDNPMFAKIFRALLSASKKGLFLYRREGEWRRWSAGNVPIVSALSHGGRILFQLTKIETANVTFLRWLFGAWPLPTRAAATHGIRPIDRTQLFQNIHTELVEIKTGMKTLPHWAKGKAKKMEGTHYGVNIGVGGIGNINPFSGNVIADDGTHGHLYVFYTPRQRGKPAGLLIGCEGSAPIDRYKGSAQAKVKPKKAYIHGWAYDQSGHAHTLGSSGEFSPTGGMKWKATEWHKDGPDSSNNAMFVDLSSGWGKLTNYVLKGEHLGWNAAP